MNQSKEIRSTVYWQTLGLISVALLAYMFFPFIDVIIYGIFIYYVARPMYREFDRRFKHKSVGAFLSLFIVVLPIVLISIPGEYSDGDFNRPDRCGNLQPS